MIMNAKKLIRLKFQEEVFKRDKNKCCFCDETSDLDAHHITDRHLMPNGGYVKENGISLCKEHHLDAEEFHLTNGEHWFEGMHPNDLYKKINSSFEQAFEKSKNLK